MKYIDIPYIYYDEMARYIKGKGYRIDGIRRSPSQVANFKGYLDIMYEYIDRWPNVLPTYIKTDMPEEMLIEFRDNYMKEMFGDTDKSEDIEDGKDNK